MGKNVEITVVFLGGSRGDAGVSQQTLTLSPNATVADAAKKIAEQFPKLAPKLPSVRWARNFEFANLDETLVEGDELGLLPPVCGGAPRARLTRDPIDPAALLNEVSSDNSGATVLFTGTVRRHSHGRIVDRIEYEAYEPMAQRQLERIAERVCTENNANDVVIAHRHGTIVVGEVSVAIAAAATHRNEAFLACRAAIEAIKHDVPIWKREITDAGEIWESWGGG